MKALCWHGSGDVRVDTAADPTIQDPRDIVIKITSTAICGSDLHLFNGFQPTMEKGDQLGHENMGEVIEVGKSISTLKVGDRVVVPFTICCGACFFARRVCSRVATGPIPMRRWRRPRWVIRRPASSGSPT
jgi:threonine dehydrogenase-like Zn-dependent dehydrogenase